MKTRLTVPETRFEWVVGMWEPEVRSDAPADKLPEVSTWRVKGEDPGEQLPAGVRDEMKRNEMKPPVEVDPVQDQQNGKSAREAKRHKNDRNESKRWFLRRTVGHCYAWRRNWWCVVANAKDGGDGEERWEDCTNGPRRGGEGAVGERAESEQIPERFCGVGKP